MGGNWCKKEFTTWIYCATCQHPVLMDVDTESHYAFIRGFAKRGKVVNVPVEYGHITQDNCLYHVHSVEFDGERFDYPLKTYVRYI